MIRLVVLADLSEIRFSHIATHYERDAKAIETSLFEESEEHARLRPKIAREDM
jgi:hypothetical protein